VTEATYDCPTCRRRQAFEQPPCKDGHGDDCPEWTCVVCGTALWVDLSADAGVGVGIGVGVGVGIHLTHVA
jgi:hypothetical protein